MPLNKVFLAIKKFRKDFPDLNTTEGCYDYVRNATAMDDATLDINLTILANMKLIDFHTDNTEKIIRLTQLGDDSPKIPSII